MKKICLVLPVLVAVLMLFSVTNVSAAACDPTLFPPALWPAGWCFESNGYRVNVVTDDPNGNFPKIEQTGVDAQGKPVFQSVFKYQITRIGGKSINFVDILIPVCIPDLGNALSPSCTPSCANQTTLYAPGVGDPNTGFGLGLTTYSTFVWKYSGPTGTISFNLKGEVFAYPNAMLLNRGTGNFGYGQILSPACAQLPYHEFISEVPNTVQKEVNVMGVDLCIESTDGTGCPTGVFSCNVSSPTVCGCPTTPGARSVWEKGTILDVGIGPGQLKQAWSEHDSRCPRTYWHTEGSCKLYVSGMGYTSSYTYAGISGYVRRATGTTPISGVTMTACSTVTGQCQTPIQTNSTGYFSLCFPPPLPPWSGTVTPSKTGFTFTPQNFSITTTQSVTNALFRSAE